MKLKKLIFFLFLLAPVGLFVACGKKTGTETGIQLTVEKYHCPMHPNYVSDKPGDCPICGMKLVPIEADSSGSKGTAAVKKIVYKSTMNPQEISDKPGKDSMGMEMVPVEVEEQAAGVKVEGLAPVKISSEKRQLIGVKTAVVQRRELIKLVRAVGTVAYDPELYSVEEEFLAALRSYENVRKSSQVEIAEGAKSLFESAKFKLKLMGLSEALIEKLAQNNLPDKSLLLTEDSKEAWVYAAIYEADLKLVRVGQSAEIVLPANETEVLIGRVAAIDPLLNSETRTVRARIVVENKSSAFKPEMYLNVSIKIPLGNLVAIPDTAVLDTGTRQVVFVDKGDGYFEPRIVKLGQKVDDYYAVLSGLYSGETIVTSANFLIDSESQLKAAMQQMTTSGTGEQKD